MKLTECRALKEGDKVYINLGNGWTQEMEFVRMIEVTCFGKIRASEMMNFDFDLAKAKNELHAMCRYIDDKGRTKISTVRPRALHRKEN